MKVAILLLVGLGVLAAVSAAVLVQWLQVSKNQGPQEVPMVEVAVAAHDLRAMKVIEVNDVRMEKTPVKDLPVGHYTSAVAPIGKILAVALVKGQVFTPSRFLAEGSPQATAAAIPLGKRAFTIYVSSRNISGGIIYPGCMVDVLATFRLRNSSRGEALATALLQRIQVFAVDRTSVVRTPEEKQGGKSQQTQQPSDLSKVTLLIDPEQAEALQLAVERGSIALTFRNPADDEIQVREGTVYNQGFVDRYGRPIDLMKLLQESSADEEGTDPNAAPLVPVGAANEPAPAVKRTPAVSVTVIRGNNVEEKVFEEGKKDAGAEGGKEGQ